MAEPAEPSPLYRFTVEIDGLPVAAFLEVSGLGSSIEVIEYREGGDKALHSRKLPGLVKFPNVTLKSGVTRDKALFDWHREFVTAGAGAKRKSVRIVLLDRAGNPVRVWKLHAAFPAKYDGPNLNAAASEIAIETFELAHEGIEVE